MTTPESSLAASSDPNEELIIAIESFLTEALNARVEQKEKELRQLTAKLMIRMDLIQLDLDENKDGFTELKSLGRQTDSLFQSCESILKVEKNHLEKRMKAAETIESYIEDYWILRPRTCSSLRFTSLVDLFSRVTEFLALASSAATSQSDTPRHRPRA